MSILDRTRQTGIMDCGWLLQTAETRERGANQILDALERRDGLGQMRTGAAEMPPGFLERFAEEFETESLPGIITTLG